MRKAATIIITALLAILPAAAQKEASRPAEIHVESNTGHVQGIAWDADAGLMYLSFTTRFIVTAPDGTVLGSIDRIPGHLGAMTFDCATRKVYASLECKDDEIGAAIADRLGMERYGSSSFYIAEIDVDAVRGADVPMEETMKLHEVTPAIEDYAAEVEVDGSTLKHRYGCSGIDGVTVGPAPGKAKGRCLYVAYGIYGDTDRTDNDYQVILQYSLSDLGKTPKKLFVKTGNTRYGVQNLAYDPHSGLLFLAVYKGSKPQYPNYDLFAVDLSAGVSKSRLDGIPYQKGKAPTLKLAREGWHFKYGSTGLCPLGDGYWYISEPSTAKSQDGSKTNVCDARLYVISPDGPEPFVRLVPGTPMD